MIEDPAGVPLLDETNVSNRLGTPLRDEYKSLLKIWPGLLVGADYDGSVRFIFAGTGVAIGPDWAKGIEFIPDTARAIGTQRDALDDAAKLPADLYLRKLEPQWFLFFQRDE